MTEHNLTAGATYILKVRRERGSTQTYTGRYLGATNGKHVFSLEGGVRLKVDDWSIENSDATRAVAS